MRREYYQERAAGNLIIVHPLERSVLLELVKSFNLAHHVPAAVYKLPDFRHARLVLVPSEDDPSSLAEVAVPEGVLSSHVEQLCKDAGFFKVVQWNYMYSCTR